ncbi:N-acetylmuramoyl-L-alanine amidase [Novosphingobium sp. 9]|uniref:N-acetylmuramoyl-L-alanine amidase family protein n=1 Tax=Novosphingobium sp. 9 TaxID=2025349 RepID=UPI0021B63564|nr:N-acetylmuramoyl-L-alanine amidase [Novosphingobium sp. 9]
MAALLSVMVLVLVSHAAVMAARADDSAMLRFDLPSSQVAAGLPRIDGPADPARPLVVIDAGHGGFDPGAGQGALREKDVALAIAKAVRAGLLAQGGIRVALTRDTDRFVSLRDRPEIARRLNADLFISIHADSAPEDTARGASVYALSEKGSDEAAQRFAASDAQNGRINGVALSHLDNGVGSILLDLSQRGAQAQSARMGSILLRELDGKVGLHRNDVQTAALAVLKAPDIPSILFETGYINNPQDAAFLGSVQGRDMIADAVVRSIRIYFATKSGL